MKSLLLSVVLPILCVPSASPATVIWQEAESLTHTGGWSNDSQHRDIMGSPYLLATGLGTPVEDAYGTVPIAQAGTYQLWVRCRDWYPSHSPGTFTVSVAGKTSTLTFGKSNNDNWQWINGGAFKLGDGDVELRVKDLTGWWGRIDAIVLAPENFTPSNDTDTLEKQRVTYNGVSQKIKDAGTYDVVVVGGGSAGLGAAISAARNGARVVLIQDRPVLGGNGSDEIRVPPMGYIRNPPDKVNVTGLAEELYPPQGWTAFADSAFMEKFVRAETNISLHLNTRAIDVDMMNSSSIKSVIAMDVRSGQRMRFHAPLFIDTTGHGWLGHYAGAEYKHGTEARNTYNEAMSPERANSYTMGNSLYKAETIKTSTPSPFSTPAWAYQWKSANDFVAPVKRINTPVRHKSFDEATRGPGRPVGGRPAGGYTWHIETGGMLNTIKDAEKIRDELFRMHIGIWGFQKNHSTKKDWSHHKLVWLNYVPGVRESRRLVGDYVMTQKDFDQQIEHSDNVAFTDWGIDDHHPLGFFTKGMDVLHVYHGRRVSIPYRSLYSKNIGNLFMAGRCMSVSHIALGGVRVQRPMMATGQAAGTAAAIATLKTCLPRDVYRSYIKDLQQLLLKDGCYIVGIKNEDPKDLALTANTRHPDLINGWNRKTGNFQSVDWATAPLDLTLKTSAVIRSIHVSLDSRHVQAAFEVQGLIDNEWRTLASTDGTRKQRHFVFNVDDTPTDSIRLKLINSTSRVRVCEIRLYESRGWTTQKEFLK